MKAKMIVVFLFLSCGVWGQTFDNPEMNVEGSFSRRQSPVDKQRNYRKRLEKQTEYLVRKRIESIRLQQELALMKKMKKMFNQNLKAIEKIN